MKLTYSFFSLLFLLFCSGCSDDIEVAKQESLSVFLTQETSTYRTKENAIIEVERFIQKDKGATRTGSPLNYSIGNEIYFYRDTITNQDYPSFYIANADGGNGYAIVSANPYTTPIIAYSESGNLSLSDTLQHPEFSFFFDLVQNYISNTEKYKTEFEEDVDNSLDMPQTRARRRPLYETRPGEWQETERIKPLISVKWGQRSPYNNAAPFIKGQRALTGCVATATAQVMAYHEKPSEYNGVSYNWSEMKKDPSFPAVAHLLRSIGNLVKMDWGVKASGADRDDIPRCFEKMGYRKPRAPQSYSQWDVITSIKAKCPVIICGNSVKGNILGIKYYQRGHAWVSDGYFHRERKVDVHRKGSDKVHHSYTEKEDYLHLNWGWEGDSNGYYLAGVFNGGDGPAFPSTRAASEGNFPYNVEIIPYINIIQ